MSFVEIIVVVLFISIIWYWAEAVRAKEVARQSGRKVCDDVDVEFLDDTVVLKKVALKRDLNGSMRLYRVYHFEFTSDGSFRYHGKIEMMGVRVINSELEPHRFSEGEI